MGYCCMGGNCCMAGYCGICMGPIIPWPPSGGMVLRLLQTGQFA